MKIFKIGIIFLLLLPTIAWSESYSQILQAITSGNIVFIGESHQHPESPSLIEQLVESAITKGECPIVGFEIDDSQQAIINETTQGAAPVSSIKIPASIDHLAMRKLISDLIDLKSKSPCLMLVAIDTGLDNNDDRDEWMAKRISDLPKDRPILVLLGALHTLKKIDWIVKTGKPSVAEILANQGFRVKSFPQRWLPEKCKKNAGRASRFVNVDKPEALTILNETLISLINANPHKSASGVVDGFVIWECA